MAKIGAAVAPAPSLDPTDNSRESMSDKLAQSTQVLMAEILSVFNPSHKIDDDPLMKCS